MLLKVNLYACEYSLTCALFISASGEGDDGGQYG